MRKGQAMVRTSMMMSGVLLAAMTAAAQSAPQAVQVPFSVDLAGTGQAGVTTCTTGIATTSGASYGDGCSPATAGLAAPQGAAVDKYGNVYVADYTDRLVRVIYNGGPALAAAITAANSGFAISAGKNAPAVVPAAGNIYTIAGVGTTPSALTVTATDGSGKFACANYAATGQPDALNSLGDGCPAAAAPVGPRDVSLDADGNLFITDYTNSRIRVLCVNCASTTMAAKLIALEQPGVTPVNGAMYTIAGYAGGYRDGYIGFGNATTAATSVSLLRSPTAAVVDASDDVYIADNTNNAVRLLYNGGTAAKNILTAQGFTPQMGYVYTIAGAGCVSAATNKTGSVTSANSCLTTTGSDAAAKGNAVGASTVWTVFLDPNNNVYYTDSGNARVKVIYGGVAAPLTMPNSAYSSLNVGYAYTFAGQGTKNVSGVAPSQLALKDIQGVGGDAKGNIFFIDYSTALFYETYAQTGLTAVIGGGNAIATASAGAYCNGGTNGPAMDAFYDGCPLTQVKMSNPRGPIVEDTNGELYFADSTGSLLRKLTFAPVFAETAVGTTSAAQSYAFTFLSAQTLTAPALTVNGGAGSVFADAGGDTCASGLVAAGGGPGTTCVVNVAFTPAKPGLAAGAVVLNTAAGAIGTAMFKGAGDGAGLVLDPAMMTTTRTDSFPAGIAVDGAGRVLVSDGASGTVLSYSGGAKTTVASGFTSPKGVAIDGAGNIFVVDAGAGTLTELPVTGTRFVVASGFSLPMGLAVDGLGNAYVVDTGNNRIVEIGAGGTQENVLGFSGLVSPTSVAVDASGNVYAEDGSQILKLTPQGAQTTVASPAPFNGAGIAVDAAGDVIAAQDGTLVEYPASGSGAVTIESGLLLPVALAIDASGNVFVADEVAGGFVEYARASGYYKFATSPANTPVELTSEGNQTLRAPSFTQTDSTNFSLAPATTNGCSGALAAGTVCALQASFAPTVGGTLTDIATFTSNAANASPITLTLTGQTASQTTSTSLSVGSARLIYGNVQTLTATVSGSLTAPTDGTVAFYSNTTTLLGTANVGANSTATLQFVPAVGGYPVTAVYQPSGAAYLTSTSGSQGFIVTPAVLTVTATDASRFYNTANPPLTYTITGFVNNDAPTVVSGTPNESTTATTSSAVGNYPITISQGTLAAANYGFVFVNGTLTITGATAQTITFGALPNQTYGVAPIALTATASSGLPVSYTVTGPATVAGSTLTITGAGPVTVTANQGGDNTYAAAKAISQSFVVAPATLTVTATSASRTYGAANAALGYTMTGFVGSDTQVTATTGAPSEATGATQSSAVGSYPITIAGGTLASTNYTFAFVNGVLSVTPATLTATANSATRVYGATNPAFSGTLQGAVNSDSLTETFTTTATMASAPGAYPIVPGAAGANVANYTVSATNGTLTITKATPSVVLGTSATSGFNGATNITLTATVTSPTSGSPTGTVTFFSGAAQIASVALAGGVAVYSTTSLPVGTDQVTAVYAGDANFAGGTSTAITIAIAAGFSVTPQGSTSLTFQPGYQQAQTYLLINPGGQNYTLSFACTGLPAKLSCAFSPATLPLSGVSTQQTVQMLVSNSNASASVEKPSMRGGRDVAFAMLPLAGLMLFGLRRRRAVRLLMVALLMAEGLGALSGCGTSPTAHNQAPGTYSFNVTVSNGSTTLQMIPYTLTIPQ